MKKNKELETLNIIKNLIEKKSLTVKEIIKNLKLDISVKELENIIISIPKIQIIKKSKKTLYTLNEENKIDFPNL